EARAGVLPEAPVAVRDNDVLHALAIEHGRLVHARIGGPSALVRQLHERYLAFDRDGPRIDAHDRRAGELVRGDGGHLAHATVISDRGGRTAGDRQKVVTVV